MVTGAAFYGGAHHLYHGIRNRAGHPYVIHSVMFILLAGFALFSASASAAHSVAELSLAVKLSVSLGMLLFATLPWFTALLLQQQVRALPTLLTCAWGALLLVNLASPYSLLYQDITAFNQVLPSGQPSAVLHTTANPVWYLVEITMLSTLIFSMYLCLQQYRKANNVIAIAPAAGLLLLLCTTFFDSFVHANLIQSAYLAPMGFLLFLVAASLHRQSVQQEANQRTPEDKSRYQLTLNFNQAPVHNWRTAPTVEQLAHRQNESPFPFFKAAESEPHAESTQTVETCSKTAETSPEPPPAKPQQDPVEAPEASQIYIDNPTVDLVSDGLVDIAVHATLILKRLEHGDLNVPELRELSRKVRTQAIETRRITHQMLRAQQSGRKPKAD